MTRITGTLHEDRQTFGAITHSFLLRMKNGPDKSSRENRITYFVLNNFFFCGKLAVYEIMWKDSVERGKPQATIWRMRIACFIRKVTNSHSKYAIIITLPLQQWLHERVSMLRYTYNTVPVL